MLNYKTFLEQNHISAERGLKTIVGFGGEHLPQKIGMQGYFAEITDTGLLFTNDVLEIDKKEIPFSAFSKAEFGLKSGQLWLQCTVYGTDFVFCLPRSFYKGASGQLLLDKLDNQLGGISLREDKDYKRYTGKLWIVWSIITA